MPLFLFLLTLLSLGVSLDTFVLTLLHPSNVTAFTPWTWWLVVVTDTWLAYYAARNPLFLVKKRPEESPRVFEGENEESSGGEYLDKAIGAYGERETSTYTLFGGTTFTDLSKFIINQDSAGFTVTHLFLNRAQYVAYRLSQPLVPPPSLENPVHKGSTLVLYRPADGMINFTSLQEAADVPSDKIVAIGYGRTGEVRAYEVKVETPTVAFQAGGSGATPERILRGCYSSGVAHGLGL